MSPPSLTSCQECSCHLLPWFDSVCRVNRVVLSWCLALQRSEELGGSTQFDGAPPAAPADVELAPPRLDVVDDRLQQALLRAAAQHAQLAGVRLRGEELEDGQHAPGRDVVAIQEAQRIGCSHTEPLASETF